MQTHPNSATLKERKQQLVFSISNVPSVAAAKRVLSELGSEEPVGGDVTRSSSFARRC